MTHLTYLINLPPALLLQRSHLVFAQVHLEAHTQFKASAPAGIDIAGMIITCYSFYSNIFIDKESRPGTQEEIGPVIG